MKFPHSLALLVVLFNLAPWSSPAATATSHSKKAAAEEEDSDAPVKKKSTSAKSKSSSTESSNEEEKPKASATPAHKKKAATGEDEAPAATTPKKEANASDEKPDDAAATPHKKHAGEKTDVPEATVAAEPKSTTPATPPLKPGGTGAPPAYIDSTELKGFKEQPEKVQQLIESALALSRQGLTYKFGSDDPAQGGMDCSGSIAYLLREQGFKEVPRDASGQYAWARKNGQFFAVVSKKAGGFEFEDLQPGDLLFWSGTYAVDRDPPVTHSMIYLGEHGKRKQRVMWGSSDGRSYDGKSRFGVGVFDFKMPKVSGEGDGMSATGKSPDFLGYARVPGLREAAGAHEAIVKAETASKPESDAKPAAKEKDDPEASAMEKTPQKAATARKNSSKRKARAQD